MQHIRLMQVGDPAVLKCCDVGGVFKSQEHTGCMFSPRLRSAITAHSFHETKWFISPGHKAASAGHVSFFCSFKNVLWKCSISGTE